MIEPGQHWNEVFASHADAELGWYECDVSQTLKFLDAMPPSGPGAIFLPGAGTSVLVDELLRRGHHIILNDISDEALTRLENRIGRQEDRLTWLHHDISMHMPGDIPKADIWIDRAVLHFLLEESAIRGYFSNLYSALRPGGYALLAEFSTAGPRMCAGLEVHRYSVAELTERLGGKFNLVTHEDYTYITPGGEMRSYIYALYRRDPG